MSAITELLPEPKWNTIELVEQDGESRVEVMVELDRPLVAEPSPRTSSDHVFGDLTIVYGDAGSGLLQQAVITCDRRYLDAFEARGQERMEWHIKMDAIVVAVAQRSRQDVGEVVGRIRASFDHSRRPEF